MHDDTSQQIPGTNEVPSPRSREVPMPEEKADDGPSPDLEPMKPMPGVEEEDTPDQPKSERT